MESLYVTLQIIASASGATGSSIPIESHQALTFGQGPEVDVVLVDDQVYSNHFSIHYDEDAIQLALLDAQAQLYLNGKLVQQATLKDRDQIQAGQTVIEIRMEDITQIRQQVLAHFKRQPKPFYAIVDPAQDKNIYPLLQEHSQTLK